MNKVILMGRWTRDFEVRYSQGAEPMAIGRGTLAVERRGSKQGENSADFIPCKCFGKLAELAEKYFRKGVKVVVVGRIYTDSYKDKDGKTVYTTEVILEEVEFAESKSANSGEGGRSAAPAARPSDGFMDIPDGIDDGFANFN